MHPFRKYILKFTDISNEEWSEVEKCLTRKEYPNGTLILKSGKICKKLYFVEDGLLRFFVFKDGTDVSKFFTESPYCFTSQKSFTEETPSNDNIETLQDSIIWEMSKSDAFDLFRYHSWSEFVRKLIQEVQFNTEQMLEAIQNETAESRYIKMIEEKSPLLMKVPLKYIASYLGIAPQSLSRIRKKYLEDGQNLT